MVHAPASRGSIPAAVMTLCLALTAVPRLDADSARTTGRTVTELAPGVYEIRHRDPYPGFVHGNTTVVVGDRDVLVVDATQTPAAAEEDIAQIRKWTDKPVRYLVNTHWHQDHSGGNAQYRAAFPAVAILAHRETRALDDATSPGLPAVFERDVAAAKKTAEAALAKGTTPSGAPLPERLRKLFQDQVDQADAVLAQAKRFTYQAPTLTFEDGVDIDLGGRMALVRHLGRGNTAGDLVVYLPQERILAVGDLLVHPVPYTFDGYPREWARTLEMVAAYDTVAIVPGHGDVQRDKTYLLQFRDLLRAVVAQVEAALRADAAITLDEVKKKVDVAALQAAMLGDDTDDKAFFDYATGSLVEMAFYEAKLR